MNEEKWQKDMDRYDRNIRLLNTMMILFICISIIVNTLTIVGYIKKYNNHENCDKKVELEKSKCERK